MIFFFLEKVINVFKNGFGEMQDFGIELIMIFLTIYLKYWYLYTVIIGEKEDADRVR